MSCTDKTFNTTRTRMKLLLTPLFILLSAMTVLYSGCGSSQNNSNSKLIELSTWVSYNNDEMGLFSELTDEFVKDWNSKNPDKQIAIRASQVPFGGLLPKLKTACQTHTTPDICRVDCAHVVPLAFGHAVYPLDELETFRNEYKSIDEMKELYVAAAIDSNIIRVRRGNDWETHVFGLPDTTNCVALFRNKSMFMENSKRLKKAGLDPHRAPKTWDELIEYGKIISTPPSSEEKRYGFAMDNSLWWSLPFFNSWGAEFLVRKDGKFTCLLDSQKSIDALTFKVNLYQQTYNSNSNQLSSSGLEKDGSEKVRVEAGAWIPGAITKDTGFTNGMYAMIMSGPWNVQSFTRAGINFEVSLLPEGPEGSSSNVGGTNLVVFKSCKYPEIAYQYIKFITSVKTQVRWCTALSQIPTMKEAFKLVSVDDKPALKTFYEQILKAKARPRVPSYEQLEGIINPEMELALKGSKTPKQALTDAVARINVEVLGPLNDAP
jgi:ABC-type glycerol-3-phosphate transport system substrate-binding protein